MRANTAQPVHEIIATRRSPRSLDPSTSLSNETLIAILEAARWAPSAFNGQPWRFFVGRNGDELFAQILASLGEFNQSWAKNAAALITVAAKTTREDGSLHADYQYDCGLAVSQMVFEVHGLILALQYEARFLRSSKSLERTTRGFENILQRYGVSQVNAISKVTAKRGATSKK